MWVYNWLNCGCGFKKERIISFDELGKEYAAFIGIIFSKKVTSCDSISESTKISGIYDFITKNL
jgi:hypothetical protein